MDQMHISPELDTKERRADVIDRIVASALETLGVAPPIPELSNGEHLPPPDIPDTTQESSSLHSSGRRDARG